MYATVASEERPGDSSIVDDSTGTSVDGPVTLVSWADIVNGACNKKMSVAKPKGILRTGTPRAVKPGGINRRTAIMYATNDTRLRSAAAINGITEDGSGTTARNGTGSRTAASGDETASNENSIKVSKDHSFETIQ